MFNKESSSPGDNVELTVHADPKSIVNLLAVDQSVLLLKSGNDITAEKVLIKEIERIIFTNRNT